MTNDSYSRRTLMARAAGLAAAAAIPAPAVRAGVGLVGKPRVAAIFTEFRFRSHAFNFLENFFRPYLFNGQLTEPGVEVVSFYADQFPKDDLAREVSRRLHVPLFGSIAEALCVGGKELAVDAVLSIVEHGDYPMNGRGQRMYPRREFFDAAVAVMRRAGRAVPLFNDKHLSYRWDWAKQMYDTSRALGVPLMAGSSVPLAERRPPLELPAGSEIEEAVSVHGGGVESYDFHGLEVLQSVVESRRGGETGISQIEFLERAELERAAEQGRWSRALYDAAMAVDIPRPPGSPRAPKNDRPTAPSHGILVRYRDGTRAAVVAAGGNANRWNFACRLRGESQVRATAFYNGPWGNRNLFKALSHAVQWLFVERRAPYPVERTLLVSGALDAAMDSRQRGGQPIRTPHLEFAYAPVDFRPFRETGASWKVLRPDTPEKLAFEPGDSPPAAK